MSVCSGVSFVLFAMLGCFSASGDATPKRYERIGYGMDGCPAGLEITTEADCQDALKSLGVEVSPKWVAAYDGLPRFCSVRETLAGGQVERMHFNSAGSGKARADLAPVCVAAATPLLAEESAVGAVGPSNEADSATATAPAPTRVLGADKAAAGDGSSAPSSSIFSRVLGAVLGKAAAAPVEGAAPAAPKSILAKVQRRAAQAPPTFKRQDATTAEALAKEAAATDEVLSLAQQSATLKPASAQKKLMLKRKMRDSEL